MWKIKICENDFLRDDVSDGIRLCKRVVEAVKCLMQESVPLRALTLCLLNVVCLMDQEKQSHTQHCGQQGVTGDEREYRRDHGADEIAVV